MPQYTILSQTSHGAQTKFVVTFQADDGYSETQTYIVNGETDIQSACHHFNDERLALRVPAASTPAPVTVVLAGDSTAIAERAAAHI